jgi:UDP-N-acetylglucosamine--N-acetylmuramyl-(pentapeptide) pyrophosphoryl-undecaprenol N-acetylglucosamine transferase
MTKKLLFIGGHHNSALATIDWLKENSDSFEFAWIGKKYVHDDNESPEFSEVSARKIPFYDLKTGKLFRTTAISYIPHVIYNLFLIPFGFLQTYFYLMRIKPDLIVSFGGYMSVPVVIMGWILGIRSVLHEQTVTVGLANKISSYFAKEIFSSWPVEFYADLSDSIKKKMIYTGLPIRNAISEDAGVIEFPRKARTIYITGGKSGSLFINQSFSGILKEISAKFNIIWSTGRRIGDHDFKQIKHEVEKLPDEIKKNVLIKEYFLEDEVGKVLNTADFVITRGGAHTIYELALIKKPAIVIPIPWVSQSEQLKNGKILEKFGLGIVLDQETLNPQKLLQEVENFSQEIDKIKENTKDKEYVASNGQEKLGHAIINIT